MATYFVNESVSTPLVTNPSEDDTQRKHATGSTTALCDCPPLSSLHGTPHLLHIEQENIVPAAPEFNHMLRRELQAFFPRQAPLSILLLHVTQVEHEFVTLQTTGLQKCHVHHAPASFLEQVLQNVQRAIRGNDELLVHHGTGAALILPDVDEGGAYQILERVYQSINLLQAETVTPPLTRETHILLGSGSYPGQGASLEQLLFFAGRLSRSLTLRPAPWINDALSTALSEQSVDAEEPVGSATPGEPVTGKVAAVPFMRLPRVLPKRLKQLIPSATAHAIRSVPVGRDHHRLTVAMGDPLNHASIDTLHTITGLTIYPVACSSEELDALLENFH